MESGEFLTSGTTANALALGAAVAFAYLSATLVLQHRRFAALVALAPLPGVLLAVCASAQARYLAGLPLAAGWTVALIMAHRLAASSGPTGSADAAKAAQHFIARFAVSAAGAFLLSGLVGMAGGARGGLEIAFASVAAVMSSSAVIAFGSKHLIYGEDFVTATNRLREWQARVVASLLPVAERRFGFSVAGIALVLAATTIAKGTWPGAAPGVALLVVTAALCVPLLAFAVLRDWRRSLAVTICTALATLFGIWWALRAGVESSPSVTTVEGWACAIGLLLQLCIGIGIGIGIGAACDPLTEDDAVAASEQAIESRSLPAVVAGSVAIAAAGVSLWHTPFAWLGFAVSVAAAMASAIVFQPAFAIAIEALIPRRGTLSARYRLR